MCGICGFSGIPDAAATARAVLQTLQCRGREAAGIATDHVHHAHLAVELPTPAGDSAFGHVLHAMVGCVAQPLRAAGTLVANCEIYNWQQLAQTRGSSAPNDAALLLELLDEKPTDIIAVLKQLDGVFAFAYERDGLITLARDLLGVKPLFYSVERGLAFASERKALEAQGYTAVRELYPRTILQYQRASASVRELQRPFFHTVPEHTEPYGAQRVQVSELLRAAVEKRVPDAPFGLLLSGGVDSSTLAVLLAAHKPRCYVVGERDSPDVQHATALAQQLDVPITVLSPTDAELQSELPTIVAAIEDANPVKVSVAATFWFACRAAGLDGCRALFSGLGSEEIFAGYGRHERSTAVNAECLSGLRKLHDRDLYRDDVITMRFGIELRLPFLDKALVEYALCIPAAHKFAQGTNKWILRDTALQLGVPPDFALRKKQAAQYGSRIQRQIERLARPHGSIAQYLRSFRPQPNKRLAALISGGKDSVLALHIMHRMHYAISCCVTLQSDNPDSYLFHTPNPALPALQAKAMGIPLLTVRTAGQQEQELTQLTEALRRAKEEYHIEGVVVGAVQSQYQRERFERVADELGLTVFAPLWQMDQVALLRALIRDKFSVVFVKVAADGLDASWLGEELTPTRIEALIQLRKRTGVHPAGEGGEYETAVLDAPLFSQRIQIQRTESIKDGLAATLHIAEATLVPK